MNVKDDFIMSPKVDFAFKEIMTNEKALRGFLGAVFAIDPKEIRQTTLRNTNLRKIHEDDKQSVLDVLVVMNDSTEIDIEIQLRAMQAWDKRSTFYLCKMVTDQTNINHFYTNLHKCIMINILDFVLFEDTADFHSVFHLNEDHRHSKYTDLLEMHVIELKKMPQSSDGSSLYDWMRFLKATRKEEFEMIAQASEYLREAVNQLELISQDEEKRIEYTAREKMVGDITTWMAESEAKGRAEGRTEGIAQGKAQERELLAELMRQKGYSDDQIKELLGDSYRG